MKITESISQFFQSSKGRWVLTGIFIVMLIGIAAYSEFFDREEPAPLISAEGDIADGATIIEPGINSDNPDYADDGQALRPDPDTIVKDPLAVQTEAAPSAWLAPLSGETGRSYGFSYDFTYNDYRFHHGIDIMAEPGTSVYAAAGGTVHTAATDSYWGGVVVIEHGGGWRSIYRCLEPAVSTGDSIEAGSALGYILESTTTEAGQEAHLHYEMYLDGNEVNPADWL